MNIKNIINIKKQFILILLIAVCICSLVVMQSCGSEEDTGTTETAGTSADDISTTEEEITTTTETPTEPPTTTEKPPIITEEVLKWTFSEDDNVFKAGNQISDLRVEEGIIKFTSIGGDPFLYSINASLGIEASDVNYIKIKAFNLSEGYGNQLFFITDDDTGWDEAKSIRGEYWYSEGEEWEIFTYDTSDCDYWEGTIKQIRFDPLTVEGDFEMEYVIFEKIVK